MKKLLRNLMVVVLLTTLLVGCGNQTNEDVKKVAVIQLVDHTSLNTIKKAFDEQMQALGYKEGENVEYIFANANGDNNTASSIVQDFKGKSPDVVVAIATPVAQASAPLAKDMPVVFAAVTDPITAKLTTTLERPDKNITGTSDEIQVDKILEKALEIDPNLKTLGVLYNKGETNSVTNVQKAKDFALKHNIKIEEVTITSLNEAQSAIDVLTQKCDAIFSPNDNTVASAMNVVATACKKAKIPFYVGADSMVQDGGFLSVGITYDDLGKETANMVDRVLKGTDVSSIPVKVFKDNLKIFVNEKTMKELDIKLPENIQNDESLMIMK